MNHNILSLDFWQNTVIYDGQIMTTGTIGCAALNISDVVIEKLDELCAPMNRFLKTLTDGAPDPALLPETKEAATEILNLLHTAPTFECLKKRLAICMTCGRVGSWKNRPTFEELAVMFEGSTASGAEQAYRKTVDKLTELLVAEDALHAVRA